MALRASAKAFWESTFGDLTYHSMPHSSLRCALAQTYWDTPFTAGVDIQQRGHEYLAKGEGQLILPTAPFDFVHLLHTAIIVSRSV